MLQMCNHAAFWARSSPLPPLPLCFSLSFLHFPSKAGRRQGQSEKFSTSQGITSTSYVTHCVLGRHQSQLMKGHQLLYRLTRLRQKSLVERGMFARVHINHSETLAGCACSLLALSSPKKEKTQINAIPRRPPPDFWPDASAPKPPAKEVQGLAQQEDSTRKS